MRTLDVRNISIVISAICFIALPLGCGMSDEELEESKAKRAAQSAERETEELERLKKSTAFALGDWTIDLERTQAEAKKVAREQLVITTKNFSTLWGDYDNEGYIVKWAFLNGTKRCDKKDSTWDPDDPDAKKDFHKKYDEFEKRTLMGKREEYKKRLTDNYFRFFGEASFKKGGDKEDSGAECVDITGNSVNKKGNISQDLEICRSPYDFKNQHFSFEVRADDDFKASINPKQERMRIETDSWIESNSVNVGSYGGKSLKVNRQKKEVVYRNASRFSFIWKVPEAEAKGLLKNMEIDFEMVYAPTGLHYHKKCERSCSTFMGVHGCDIEEIGFGVSLKAKIPELSVKINGTEVYGIHELELPEVTLDPNHYVMGLSIPEPAGNEKATVLAKENLVLRYLVNGKNIEQDKTYRANMFGEIITIDGGTGWRHIDVTPTEGAKDSLTAVVLLKDRKNDQPQKVVTYLVKGKQDVFWETGATPEKAEAKETDKPAAKR